MATVVARHVRLPAAVCVAAAAVGGRDQARSCHYLHAVRRARGRQMGGGSLTAVLLHALQQCMCRTRPTCVCVYICVYM